jgi:protein MpaA
VQKLGKNSGRYHGETVDIRRVLGDIKSAAQRHGWTAETFGSQGEFRLLALHRRPRASTGAPSAPRVYLSSGIHGDEPAGPSALRRLLQEDRWPDSLEIWICPCLNPGGFRLNRRENPAGVDLNRDYLQPASQEITAHTAWLERQPAFDLSLCLHEDWESNGFYVYELNPDGRPSLAGPMIQAVARVCPIDRSETIEGRPARDGVIRPDIDPRTRPQWPEAFYLLINKTRLSYTLEAPSDFELATRVDALVLGVGAALNGMASC